MVRDLAWHDKKITSDFFNRNTEQVAKELLGTYLIHTHNHVQKIGKIVEVEAYLGEHDLACHTSKGFTPRTQTMYGPPGHAYVYMIYGMYHCFNVVTEPEGHGSAVLIRALEPTENIDQRTQGPGLLCKAMGIDKSLNGVDLLGESLYLAHAPEKKSFDIVAKPRIGVAYAKEWAEKPLRFYIKDSPYISKK